MLTSALTFIFFLSSILLFYFVSKWKKRKYPSPPVLSGKLPIIGHIHQFRGGSVDMWELVKKMSRESLKHGGVITFSLGPRTAFVVTDPEDCATVSNECLQKDFFYDFAKPWLGDGILTADVPLWKQHRKLLNPAFKQNVLSDYMYIFNDQAKKLTQLLSAEVGKGPFEVDRYLSLNNLETICRTALGADPKTNNQLLNDYVIALEQILNILLLRFQQPWLQIGFLYRFSQVRRDEIKAIKVLHKLSKSVLEKRKLQLEKKLVNGTKYNTSENFIPFMDAILEVAKDNDVYTDKQIQNEVDTIIFGGYDTAATALIYILILIGSHQDVQEKIYEELTATFKPTDTELNKQDLSKLVYLEAVIKESLRLYPIGPVVARYAEKDVKLKNYTIPSGSSCFMFFWGLHRHSSWGPDAELFRPERWLDSSLPDNPHSFGAFSVGKRACIGRVYAMMSMKTTLAHLLRRYRVYGDISALVLKVDVFLKPESGHHITIEERIKSS